MYNQNNPKYNSEMNKTNVDRWDVKLSEYEQGNFGKFSGHTVRYPRHFLERFVKTINNKRVIDNVSIFKETAEVVISAIMVRYPILANIPISILDTDTSFRIKRAVYCAVQHSAENGLLIEVIRGTSYNTSNFSVARDEVNLILSDDQLGVHCMNELMISGIGDYQIDTPDVVWQESKNGSVKIIGKMDMSEIPDVFQ